MELPLKIQYHIGAGRILWEKPHAVMSGRNLPFNVILYVHSGSYRLQREDEPWRRYLPGEAFVVPPFITHAVEIDEASVISWAHISYQESGGTDFLSRCELPDSFTGEAARQLGCFCEALAEEARLDDDVISAVLCQRDALSLLAFLLQQPSVIYMRQPLSQFAEEVSCYIYERIGTEFSIKEMAAAFHMSASAFRRVFTHYFHVPPVVFIQKRRLEIACGYLLNEELTVAEAAEKAGYHDPCYFSRVFARYYLMPPSRYKENYRRSAGIEKREHT